jgi:hypothetical protein
MLNLFLNFHDLHVGPLCLIEGHLQRILSYLGHQWVAGRSDEESARRVETFMEQGGWCLTGEVWPEPMDKLGSSASLPLSLTSHRGCVGTHNLGPTF